MQAGGPLSTSDAASEDHTRAHDNASDDGDSINSFKASVGVSTQEREGIATSATMDPTKQLPPQPGMPYIQRARPQIRLSPSYTKPAKAGYLSKYAGVNYQRRFFVLRDSILLYYVTHEHPEPKGVFLLDQTRIQKWGKLCPDNLFTSLFGNVSAATPFSLVIVRPSGAAVELCASNEYELDQWIEAFVKTGACERLTDGNCAVPGPPGVAPPPNQYGSRQGMPQSGNPHQGVVQPGMARPGYPQPGTIAYSPQGNQHAGAAGANWNAPRGGWGQQEGGMSGNHNNGSHNAQYAMHGAAASYPQNEPGGTSQQQESVYSSSNNHEPTGATNTSLEHLPSDDYNNVAEGGEDDYGLPSSDSKPVGTITLGSVS